MVTPFEIIALAETVAHLGGKLYEFFSALKDAPQEVRNLCSELVSLRNMLLEIGISASKIHDAMTSNSKALGMEAILTSLKGCESEFNTLWLAVSPLSTDRGLQWGYVLKKLSKSVRWILEADSMEKSINRLERVKQTLALAILLSGMKIGQVILETLSFVRYRVQENGTVIVSHLQELERTLLFNIRQVEYRLLQRVSDLSSVAAGQHAENDRRITNLSDTIPQSQVSQPVNPQGGSHLESNARDISPSGGTTTLDLADPPPANTSPQGRLSENENPDGKGDESIKLAFQDAMRTCVSTVSPKDMELLSHSTIEDFTADFKSILNSRKRIGTEGVGVLSRIPSKLARLGPLMDVFVQGSPQYSALMWGSIRLVLQAVERTSELETVLEVLNEISHAIEACEREYTLYPEPKLKELVVALYNESISGLLIILKKLTDSPAKRILKQTWPENQLQLIAKNTKEFSEKIIKEVEYLHRRELRQAHVRLREVDRKQDQVIRTLEEQQRILISLQEEQKVVAAITDHQKVLQMLQQLLARFSSSSETCAVTIDSVQREFEKDI